MTTEHKVEQISSYINGLIEKAQVLESKIDHLPAPKRADAKGQIGLFWQEVDIWRAILDSPEKYEIALSNYERAALLCNGQL